MKVDEFMKLMKKLTGFKVRLENEGIKEIEQQRILKIYIEDMTDKINTNLLKVV